MLHGSIKKGLIECVATDWRRSGELISDPSLSPLLLYIRVYHIFNGSTEKKQKDLEATAMYYVS